MALIDQINTLNSWANECRLLLYNVEDGLDWREPSAYDKTKNGGIGWIACANRQVLSELIEAMQWFVYGYTTSFDYVYWGNVHIGLYNRAGPVTMQKILETMWESTPLETFFFVNYIDGMRAAIWNKEIQQERLEEIYSHFLI